VIVGPEEWSSEVATVRDMAAHDQEQIPLKALRQELVRRGRRDRV
jgi:histidyl-tRNA synthetase